jgi:hypothetical protein
MLRPVSHQAQRSRPGLCFLTCPPRSALRLALPKLPAAPPSAPYALHAVRGLHRHWACGLLVPMLALCLLCASPEWLCCGGALLLFLSEPARIHGGADLRALSPPVKAPAARVKAGPLPHAGRLGGHLEDLPQLRGCSHPPQKPCQLERAACQGALPAGSSAQLERHGCLQRCLRSRSDHGTLRKAYSQAHSGYHCRGCGWWTPEGAPRQVQSCSGHLRKLDCGSGAGHAQCPARQAPGSQE